jgi:predicted nucleotidyltransferase
VVGAQRSNPRITQCLKKIEGIGEAYLYGSFARNQQDAASDLDVLVTGNPREEVLAEAIRKLERQLGREINYTVLTEKEFESRRARKDAFLVRTIERFLQSAEKKLAFAYKILAFDEEACLQQAYEAMLKASLSFMFSHGLRARSQPGHHTAIIEFVRGRIDKRHAGLLTVFDRLRRKREYDAR